MCIIFYLNGFKKERSMLKIVFFYVTTAYILKFRENRAEISNLLNKTRLYMRTLTEGTIQNDVQRNVIHYWLEAMEPPKFLRNNIKRENWIKISTNS